MTKPTISKGVADVYHIRTPDGDFAAVYIEHGSYASHGTTNYWVRVASTGSFGTYGTYWNSVGSDHVSFLTGIDFDYAMKNLTSYKHREFDLDESVKQAKVWLFVERRREDLTKEEAREAFDVLLEVSGTNSKDAFVNSLLESNLPFFNECYEWIVCERYKSDCVGFWENIWSVLVKQLQEEKNAKQ
ncbi:hypothetical protein QN372_00205 [Undibacterium sp. RTI2.1]|uniref:hypothetical protein n=1 Tax=unclassified Undibacterium TaxID=2630295 RepID=UPI002AB39B50|nr:MULTISPECIES: hypothetical protein [unclassified Undibacterium]MDY7537563.1 hypothetical protein [Undibacterium sp. 5I1]MEB0029160.1 hypothetical protein [Undibacterium sp. RTI2.1]MEB0115468.1 hypothetical protein [Undibacterium sp. RTI2.2]MEB0231948.1 hypothetical protein [Undibacterium sp. 10I3]MEB0256299.1 hypothetical protein [Undibacterium sp. 5I1]